MQNVLSRIELARCLADTTPHADDISPTGVDARYYIHNGTINRRSFCSSQQQHVQKSVQKADMQLPHALSHLILCCTDASFSGLLHYQTMLV